MKKKVKNQFNKNKIWRFGRAENTEFERRVFLKLSCVISVLQTSPERTAKMAVFKQVSFLNRRNCFNNEEITHLLGLNVTTGALFKHSNMFTTQSLLIFSVNV